MIDEGSNGMSYDFGVAIAKGTVAGLAATVAGVVALTGTIVSLVSASDEMDKRMNTNRIAFGGYANTMKAVQFAQQKTMEGAGFALDDQLKGFKDLQRSGMDAVKNYDLVAAAANGTGSSFSDMTAIIRGGDFGQLADMGIITDRMAMSMDNMGMSTRAASAQVVKLLKEANGKGMFKDFVPTLESIMMRFKQFKANFVQAIVGDPKDPEGLAFNVKKYMNQIADFVGKHINRIIYIGKIIGRAFRMFLDVIGTVVKSLFGYLGKMMHVQEKSKRSMQDSILSFGLWAQIQTERIGLFFEKYGDYIWGILKILAIYKAFKFANSLWWEALKGAAKYFRVVKFGLLRQVVDFRKAASGSKDAISAIQRSAGGLMGGIANMFKNVGSYLPMLTGGLGSAATSAWSFAAAMLANPIGLIVLAVAALVAGVVLLIAYWDDLWYEFQSMSDAWSLLLGPLFLIIKYWEEIKATVSNFWNMLKLWGLEAYLKILGYWNDFKQFFVDMWNGIVDFFSGIWESITATFHEWFDPLLGYLGDFFKPLIDAASSAWEWLDSNFFTPISDFFSSIGNWINDNLIKPLKDFFSGIGDFFGGIFGKGVDKSNQMLQSQAASTTNEIDKQLKAGVITQQEADAYKKLTTNTASQGISNTQVQQIKADKKISIEKERAQKKAEKNGTSISSPMSTGSMGSMGSSDLAGMGGTTNKTTNNYNVTINSGASDPNAIADIVMKQLKQQDLKNKLRKGE